MDVTYGIMTTLRVPNATGIRTQSGGVVPIGEAPRKGFVAKGFRVDDDGALSVGDVFVGMRRLMDKDVEPTDDLPVVTMRAGGKSVMFQPVSDVSVRTDDGRDRVNSKTSYRDLRPGDPIRVYDAERGTKVESLEEIAHVTKEDREAMGLPVAAFGVPRYGTVLRRGQGVVMNGFLFD